jgi:hypothetical protein
VSPAADVLCAGEGPSVEFDTTNLMLSLLFGAVGMGLLMYGKKAGRIPHLAAGLSLMIVPYFISNPIAMTGICLLLCIAPYFIAEG